jgi:hypothetical protein
MEPFFGGAAFALVIACQFLAVVAASATILDPSVREPRKPWPEGRGERYRARCGLTVMSCARRNASIRIAPESAAL